MPNSIKIPTVLARIENHGSHVSAIFGDDPELGDGPVRHLWVTLSDKSFNPSGEPGLVRGLQLTFVGDPALDMLIHALTELRGATSKPPAHGFPPVPNVEQTRQEVFQARQDVYGSALLCHENIGLCWTALVQQHYQIRLPHPLPPDIVGLMMASLKAVRSCLVYHPDNYVDGHNYLEMAGKFLDIRLNGWQVPPEWQVQTINAIKG